MDQSAGSSIHAIARPAAGSPSVVMLSNTTCSISSMVIPTSFACRMAECADLDGFTSVFHRDIDTIIVLSRGYELGFVLDISAFTYMRHQRRLWRAHSFAANKPTGPAPTINTSVSVYGRTATV